MITEAKSAKWRDDADAETIMNLVGVTHCIREINFDDIDDVASANNCARMNDPLNLEKVEEYEASMRRGDTFPRIVVEQGKKGFVVLGGNQRYAAAKRYGLTFCEAYVVKPLTENHRQAVIRSLNSRHGWGTEKSERIDHAVYLVNVCGFNVDDAAKLMSVSKSMINQRVRAEDTRKLLGEAGLNSNKLTVSALDSLCRIKDEDIQKQVAKFTIDSGAAAVTVEAIASQIVAAKGKAKKSEIVKNWIKENAYQTSSIGREINVIKTPRRDKFFRRLNEMVDFLDRGNDGTGFTSMGELSCNEQHDGESIRMLATKIIFRLKTISGV